MAANAGIVASLLHPKGLSLSRVPDILIIQICSAWISSPETDVMNVFRSVGVLLAAGAMFLGSACGETSSAGKASHLQAEDPRSFKWGVIFNPSPRVIKVGGGVGYCVGDPKPRIAKPDIKYQGDEVYIALELKKPPKPPRKRPQLFPKGKTPVVEGCAGVELLVTRKLTLRRNLSDLTIYDSGVEPPEQVWPR
jgi:hypothetical protein